MPTRHAVARRALLRAETLYTLALVGGVSTAAVALYQAKMEGPLPPVVFPAENPLTESKRVLGKILFWDEQLSSDSTMSCGSCHITGAAGTDPTLAPNPGNDGVPGTPDDLRTSFGVIAADANEDYAPNAVFGLEPQATGRSANSALLAMYAPELFWDGRASDTFTDPITGDVVIATGGALESQVVGPPLSDVEMAHADRDWVHVASKLEHSAPLALATDWPTDIQFAIDTFPSYPELFEQAFGDGAITPVRIAMAIATYERTLVADETPWDMFMMGDNSAMTNQQIQGWTIFENSQCVACHTPPLFTDHSFRNIGLHPNIQDIGREEVTGSPADRGKFKTPSLRNAGLKASFMHTGQFDAMNQVFAFYAGPGAPGNPNRDALLPVPIAPPQQGVVANFILNALTDPRVAGETFPFDRPRLFSERTSEHAVVVAAGTTGSGGLPSIIANIPANLGNEWFKIGLGDALAGANATLAIADQPPVAGVLAPDSVVGPVSTGGTGVDGFATAHWPIPLDASLDGQLRYFQWSIDDPAAPGGVARSPVVRVTLFCGERDCASPCLGDVADDFGTLGDDGMVSFGDFLALLGLIGPCPGAPGCTGDIADDFGTLNSGDGMVSFGDFLALLGLIGPCP